MGRKGPGKKLVMGESHSLRPNKAYLSHEALCWVNDQENANETICRAVQFYYSYFNEVEGIAERQPVGTTKVGNPKKTKMEVVSIEQEVENTDEVSLDAVNNMLNSVRR